MSGRVRLVRSGISLIDHAWGGFYEGGSYLVVGPRKSGRTSLGLQFASIAIAQAQACVYFTTLRPHQLAIQADAIGLPLDDWLNEQLITVIRILPPGAEEAEGGIAEYVEAIQETVRVHQPSRMVIDELTPFAAQESERELDEAFDRLTGSLEDNGVTALYTLGEPANPRSRRLTQAVNENMIGTIYLQRDPPSTASDAPRGKILISPNVGHPEGHFMAYFTVEPHSAFRMEDRGSWLRPEVSAFAWMENVQHTLPSNGLAESAPRSVPEDLCEAREFLDLLNAHVDDSESTGVLPSVAAFRVTPSGDGNSLLTLEQILRAVREAGGADQRLCLHGNTLMVLPADFRQPDIHAVVVGRVQEALNRISGSLIQIPRRFPDADTLFEYVEKSFSTQQLLV